MPKRTPCKESILSSFVAGMTAKEISERYSLSAGYVRNVIAKYKPAGHIPNKRIDSSRGYFPDNIIVVSYRANALKNDATVAELIAISDFYKNLEIVKSFKTSLVGF